MPNRTLYSFLTLFALTSCGAVEDPTLYPEYSAATAKPIPEKAPTKPNPQRNLYWGDLHIHTSLSSDAWTMGVRALPDDAYTFTRGGEIEHAGGYGVQLSRPLDFAAVTDHSEYMGVLRALNPKLPLSERSYKTRMRNDGKIGNTLAFLRTTLGFSLKDVVAPGWQKITASAWQDSIASTERHYTPGVFTTFVAYEWSSLPNSANLHRNVVYRGSKVPDLPYSSLESNDPRDLWAALDAQREAGMDNFAIPHNGNVSNGRMYDSVTFDGGTFSEKYAATRMRNEPISEIFQVKGSSETHPMLSPDDPFAGFEIFDQLLSPDASFAEPSGGYTRDALRLGIELSHKEGFNPYRFGVIGASDGHNATSPVEEDNYHGKLPILDGSAATRLRENSYLPRDMLGGTIWSAAGLAAVWAQENTRESLFDAMRRKETYATSGPRMAVRFFGGWRYSKDLFNAQDWITVAQQNGVPMGAELPLMQGDAPPTFAVWAIRDPQSGNLDRVQIVKGWVTSEGATQEKVFDVVWSGDRTLDANGKLPPVGNTVNVAEASYTNVIGKSQLSTVWTDPEFDPNREAFYYARVLEIPTPRWSTFDAKALGIEAPEPAWLQERAVTSAIWYKATVSN